MGLRSRKRHHVFDTSRRLDPDDAPVTVLGRHRGIHPPLTLNEDEEAAARSRARQQETAPDDKRKWWEK